jgi:phosphohistidine phosphatase
VQPNRLWLVRHAKSDWTPGVHDFDRGLNARGHRDGPYMAQWCSRQSNRPEWIWSSTANRALTTARYLAPGWSVDDSRLVLSDALYHASAETALEVLHETPEGVHGAALVFHNPGITDLVNWLAGESVTDNLPTLGIAEFTTDQPLAECRSGGFKLQRIVSPRLLRAASNQQSSWSSKAP